jgi:hypothetical protein
MARVSLQIILIQGRKPTEAEYVRNGMRISISGHVSCVGFRHCVQLDKSNPKPEARNLKELPVSELLTDLACSVLI